MVGVSPDHTSVPRWSSAPTGVDPSGVFYLIVSAGAAGDSVANRWVREIEQSTKPLWSFRAEPTPGGAAVAAAALASRLRYATVGVRVMVAGPELFGLDCVRAAHTAGAIDAELTIHVTGSETKRVNCLHCDTDTEAEVAIAETVRCTGCRRELVVYHHVSRRLGAYFGYMVDAETQPA